MSEIDGLKHSQISYVTLKMNDKNITPSVPHQRILYGERTFNLEEIYGLESRNDGSTEVDSSLKYVISQNCDDHLILESV